MNTPDHFVRTQHNRLRRTALVWSLALAVLCIAFAGAEKIGWLRHGVAIGLAPAAVALVLMIYWLVRLRRIEQRAIARAYDSEWALQARLEAAGELSADKSAFAAAQRDDAAKRLATRRAPRAIAWNLGCVMLVIAVLFALTEFGVFSFRLLTPTKVAAVPEPEEDISASIDWRSPKSEIKATSIEEIALVASSTSRTGFRKVTLEVSVNGESRFSHPLEPAQLAELAKKGAHEIKLPLYLDETAAEEFDVVAYHLRAERRTKKPSPVITSPLQFVQIRPAREDVRRLSGLPGKLDKLGQLQDFIGNLKVAQLSLLKQNFLLAHAPISHTGAEWIEANTAVFKDQATLAEKSTEARTFAISEDFPALVVDNLTQVIPLMESAAKQIAASANEPATKPQGKALGLLTELEKLIQKIILEGGGKGAPVPPPPPSVTDPFKDEQRYKMPPRSGTAAGKLELLAKEQTEQAKKLEPTPPSPGDKSPSAGSPADGKPKPGDARDLAQKAAEQAELAARAEQLAKAGQLSPEAQKAAAQAARDAAAAANQLKNGDVNAARSPAQSAADTLRDAAAAQEKAGREAARAQLEAARRALNEAAKTNDSAKRAEQLAGIAQKLQAEARAQQESGSAEAALKLAAAAAEIAKTAKDAANNGADRIAKEAPGSGNNQESGRGILPRSSGQQEGTQPGTDKASTSANATGDKPTTGDQPGSKPSAKPGSDAGNQPGKEPGSEPGKEPGTKAGDQPGDKPGAGSKPGEGDEKGEGKGKGEGQGTGTKPDPAGDQKAPGATPGDQPGSTPDSGSGAGKAPSPAPGSEGSGAGSGPGKGKAPGSEPGTESGSEAGSESGSQPGVAPSPDGKGPPAPGSGPGTSPTGSGSGPGSGSGAGSGSTTSAERAEQTAAMAQASLSTRAETSARAARQLQRGATGDGNQADSPAEGAQSRPAELVLGAQLANAVLGTPEANQLAAEIIRTQRVSTSPANVTMTPDIRAAVDRLRALLAAAQSDDRRDETVRRFNPEDMDPAYRETIESYFERLSREARRP